MSDLAGKRRKVALEGFRRVQGYGDGLSLVPVSKEPAHHDRKLSDVLVAEPGKLFVNTKGIDLLQFPSRNHSESKRNPDLEVESGLIYRKMVLWKPLAFGQEEGPVRTDDGQLGDRRVFQVGIFLALQYAVEAERQRVGVSRSERIRTPDRHS